MSIDGETVVVHTPRRRIISRSTCARPNVRSLSGNGGGDSTYIIASDTGGLNHNDVAKHETPQDNSGVVNDH